MIVNRNIHTNRYATKTILLLKIAFYKASRKLRTEKKIHETKQPRKKY